MLNQKDVQQLLEDLYEADPSLKTKEKEVKQLIELMMKNVPDAKIDKTFLKELKIKLLNQVKSLSISSMKNELIQNKPKRFWPILGMSFGGVAIVIMAAFFVMQEGISVTSKRIQTADLAPTNKNINTRAALVYNRIQNNAFGQIAYQGSGNQSATLAGKGEGRNAMAPAEPPVADAASTENAASVSTIAPNVASAPMMNSKMAVGRAIMPPYEQTVVEYEYKGDMLDLKNTMTDVLKRTQGSFDVGNLASAIRGLNLGVADLGSFDQAKVSDISIYQDTPHGYQIYISPRNGTMSIDQNWDQWKDATVNCQDEACWKSSQIKASDVPSNDELIKLADQFLDDHKIDRSSYGKGEVDRSWEQYASANPDYYIPDMIQVVYPLQINHQDVYMNGGSKVGLNVGINLRVKRVSSVYNIQQLTFDASQYEPETNFEILLDQAKKGGLESPIRYLANNPDVKVKKVTAELGTPSQALVQTYQYKNGQTNELYVPALIFPVTKKADSDQVWTPTSIIVPLVKGVESDIPQIMPMMKGGVEVQSSGAGSSGSSAGVQVVPPTPSVAPMMQR